MSGRTVTNEVRQRAGTLQKTGSAESTKTYGNRRPADSSFHAAVSHTPVARVFS